MYNIFRRTGTLITQVDDFLNAIDEGILVYREGIQAYLSGRMEDFRSDHDSLFDLEEKADTLRRVIRSDLYHFSLVPDFRADILELLEKLDDVVDILKDNLHLFDIEHPLIPEEVKREIARLSEVTTHAAEALVLAARAFFREVNLVNDRLHRVYFYEREADTISGEINRKIFQHMEEIELSRKQQLRHFINRIDNVANISEDAADLLTILAIKRTV